MRKSSILLTAFSLTVILSCAGCTEMKIATTSNIDYVFSSDHLYMQVLEPEDVKYLYKIRPAKNFGGDFHKQHYNIELVPGEPYDGCSVLENANDIRGMVALLQRGQCSFVTKTYHAEQAGALAVIIADSDISDIENQVDMVQDGTEREVTIPSLYLLGKDGHMIKSALERYGMNSALINIPVNITGIPYPTSMQPPWILW